MRYSPNKTSGKLECIVYGSVLYKTKMASMYPISFIYKMELLMEVHDLEQLGFLWLRKTPKEVQGHQLVAKWKVKLFSHVRLFATPWTHQAPLLMEFLPLIGMLTSHPNFYNCIHILQVSIVPSMSLFSLFTVHT